MKILYLIVGLMLIIIAVLTFTSPSFAEKMMGWSKKWRRLYGVKTEYLPSAKKWNKVWLS